MAEGEAPAPKKAKRSAPVARVSAEERAKQFKEDFYSDQVEYTAGTADELRACAKHLRPHPLINLFYPTPPATFAHA